MDLVGQVCPRNFYRSHKEGFCLLLVYFVKTSGLLLRLCIHWHACIPQHQVTGIHVAIEEPLRYKKHVRSETCFRTCSLFDIMITMSPSPAILSFINSLHVIFDTRYSWFFYGPDHLDAECSHFECVETWSDFFTFFSGVLKWYLLLCCSFSATILVWRLEFASGHS